jgi:DNA-binding transcriptional MocR family regulator
MMCDGVYTTTAAVVMIAIAAHNNEALAVTRASYETFWDEVGVPRSTVKYTLKSLIERGYLTHTKGTYIYGLGPLVQNFLPKSDADGKPAARQFGKPAAPPPAPSRIDKLQSKF